jgi:hypothetical protein
MIRVNSKAKMNLVHHGAEQSITTLSFIFTHRKLGEVEAEQFAELGDDMHLANMLKIQGFPCQRSLDWLMDRRRIHLSATAAVWRRIDLANPGS